VACAHRARRRPERCIQACFAGRRSALAIAPNLKDARDSLAVALGEKPDPNAPSGGQSPNKPAAGQQPLSLPTSPTLGPSPMSAPADSFDPLRLRQ